jgi:phospholipid/cholesterol/gamma-HCH transport system ATP-binding protein
MPPPASTASVDSAVGPGPAAPAEDPSVRSERYQIRVRGVQKAFGGHPVLRGVDLDVERGRINIIIGGSGQGKSVLMKHLMGLLKPDAGHIWVDGLDVVPMTDVQLNAARRKFGMVFQYAALFDSLTIEENIAFPLVEHSRMKASAIAEEVRKIMEALKLPPVLLARFPSELSGGQRKRVGLARALMLKPEILLYDEPTTGLDPIATKNVDDMIRDISKQTGVTSLVISHDMASTLRIGDRISMLYEGRIVVSGSCAEILDSPDPVLRQFLETSGAVPARTADAGVDASVGPTGGAGS